MIVDLNESGNTPHTGKLHGVKVSNVKKDGWNNALIGLGKRNVDKTVTTSFGSAPIFTDSELTHMYMGDGLGKRIIDLKPQDAIREWITVPGDDDEKILTELKRLKAQTAFKKALSYARLYRGSIIVMVEKGVLDLEKPLQKNPKGLVALRVYSAARIQLLSADISDDPTSMYFDDMEYFTINTRRGTTLRVHASRCLVFKGEEAPDEGTIDLKYLYWGLPAIMPIYNEVKNWGSIKQALVNLLLEFNVGKYTLSNLAQMLTNNDQASLDKIYDRMDIINASKSMINSVLLGEGEGYERDSATVSGLSQLLEILMMDLAAVAGYPVTRLWGRSPQGMNATGESDETIYYDDIASMQEIIVQPPLQRLVNIIGGYTSVSTTKIVFNPLKQLTEKEQAEVDKLNAETDGIYIDKAVVTPEEVSAHRFPDKEDSSTSGFNEGSE